MQGNKTDNLLNELQDKYRCMSQSTPITVTTIYRDAIQSFL